MKLERAIVGITVSISLNWFLFVFLEFSNTLLAFFSIIFKWETALTFFYPPGHQMWKSDIISFQRCFPSGQRCGRGIFLNFLDYLEKFINSWLCIDFQFLIRTWYLQWTTPRCQDVTFVILFLTGDIARYSYQSILIAFPSLLLAT